MWGSATFVTMLRMEAITTMFIYLSLLLSVGVNDMLTHENVLKKPAGKGKGEGWNELLPTP